MGRGHSGVDWDDLCCMLSEQEGWETEEIYMSKQALPCFLNLPVMMM